MRLVAFVKRSVLGLKSVSEAIIGIVATGRDSTTNTVGKQFFGHPEVCQNENGSGPAIIVIIAPELTLIPG